MLLLLLLLKVLQSLEGWWFFAKRLIHVSYIARKDTFFTTM